MTVSPTRLYYAAMTLTGAPLPYRLHLAADWVAELNAMQGLASERGAVSPKYLREEAARMDREVQP